MDGKRIVFTMKILLFLGLLFLSSLAHAGFKTDALNVTTSSVTINGISYSWPSTNGSSGQCLSTDGGTPAVLSWTSCSGGTVTTYVLLEDSTILLLEDGTNMLLEN